MAVDNLGPSGATVDAAVIDVLPAGVSFVSFVELPPGVVCDPPVGRTISCTIPKGLLELADPPVSITMNVTVASTPQTVPLVNKVIVTSSDDAAPCAVTPTDITCEPANTNNYDDVSVGFTSLTIVKDAQPKTSTPFQFTVTGGALPSSFSLVDDGTNGNRQVIGNIAAGQQYVITEFQPADGSYAHSAIELYRRRDRVDDRRPGGVSLTLAPGDQVVCTFVNGAIDPGGVSTTTGAGSGTGTGTGTSAGPLAFTGSGISVDLRARHPARRVGSGAGGRDATAGAALTTAWVSPDIVRHGRVILASWRPRRRPVSALSTSYDVRDGGTFRGARRSARHRGRDPRGRSTCRPPRRRR